MTRKLVLHIDRLVLRGVDRQDVAAISVAMAAELQTKLQSLLGPGAEGGAGTLATQGSTHALQAGRVHLPPGADATVLGQAVAGRIARASSASSAPHGGKP